MRDPFENYDSWLERPYQEAAEVQDRAEWIAENTTYTTDCCGEPVADDVALPLLAKFAELAKLHAGPDGRPRGYGFTDGETAATMLVCPKCGDLSEIVVTEPAERDDEADCENGGDGRDD